MPNFSNVVQVPSLTYAGTTVNIANQLSFPRPLIISPLNIDGTSTPPEQKAVF